MSAAGQNVSEAAVSAVTATLKVRLASQASGTKCFLRFLRYHVPAVISYHLDFKIMHLSIEMKVSFSSFFVLNTNEEYSET